MIRLLRAEFLKLRTTQVWFWMLLAAIALSVLVVVGGLASNSVHNRSDIADMFANSNSALLAVFILGILGLTTEFRYQTITPTVLQTPSRWAIVTAKLITYAAVGVAYSLVCIAFQLAVALPWLSAKDLTFTLSDDRLQRVLFGLPLVFALFAIIGIGFGALVRNQIVAVTVGLIFLVVLENVIAAIPHVREAYPYTPVGAVLAILFGPESDSTDFPQTLTFGGGVLVLLLWAFIPAIVGAGYTMNRDIT